MSPVIIAVLVVAGLALAAGLILAVASIWMAVPRDEKMEALREALPGANCGACGYSGCDGYAQAMAHEGAMVGLCAPGGEEVAKATAEILGVSGSTLEKKAAFVRCGGCDEFVKHQLTYSGLRSCAAASQFYGGDLACRYGCLGYGDCAAACEYNAITVENGLARIDQEACKACGLCLKACPKKLITLLPVKTSAVVKCSSHDKGAVVRKICEVGCIACMKCVKSCAFDAIHVENFLSVVDPQKCTGCGECVKVCPTHCIAFQQVNEAGEQAAGNISPAES